MSNPGFLEAHILIVDDQAVNIEILSGYLDMIGYRNIRSTTDPRLVMDLFHQVEPDILLLDLTMPYLTGFDVLEQLKGARAENTFLPVLVLTADVSAESKRQALSGGASDFLTKPFDLSEVGLRINNLLFARFLHKQIMNQNQLLEERVIERTRELENMNRELTVARDKAEESDKLKTAFLNNISHEIRTPFNGILGFLSLMEEEETSAEERRLYNQVIHQSADRLLKTINDIVEIAKIQAGQAPFSGSRTSVRSILDDLISVYQPVATHKELEFNVINGIDPAKDVIWTDESKLTTILSGLIDNAVKFTRSGSVEVTVTERESVVEFAVRDTGLGIARDKQQIIFERFLQGDFSNTRQFEGAGLGLSIAKAYAEILGGSISLQSEPGAGSTFILTIPGNRDDSAVNPGPGQPAMEAGETKKLILVAEDDEVNFHYAEMVLKSSGFDVIRAVTGTEAIQLCETVSGIDLVLMDIRLPELDGYSATREILEFRPDLPILALTAFALPGEAERAKEAGCTEYIAKPVGREDLLIAVRRYFGGKARIAATL